MTKIAWKISLPSVLKEQADHTIVATICGLEVPISRGPWHDTRLDHRQRSEGNPFFFSKWICCTRLKGKNRPGQSMISQVVSIKSKILYYIYIYSISSHLYTHYVIMLFYLLQKYPHYHPNRRQSWKCQHTTPHVSQGRAAHPESPQCKSSHLNHSPNHTWSIPSPILLSISTLEKWPNQKPPTLTSIHS